MRLWHQELIPFLPRAQLLGQHRECCALRGKGWGKKHSTVDYVFKHSAKKLVHYHHIILEEMERRGYKPNRIWYKPEYRGKNMLPWSSDLIDDSDDLSGTTIYPEHNDRYYHECLDNLSSKGIKLF